MVFDPDGRAAVGPGEEGNVDGPVAVVVDGGAVDGFERRQEGLVGGGRGQGAGGRVGEEAKGCARIGDVVRFWGSARAECFCCEKGVLVMLDGFEGFAKECGGWRVGISDARTLLLWC